MPTALKLVAAHRKAAFQRIEDFKREPDSLTLLTCFVTIIFDFFLLGGWLPTRSGKKRSFSVKRGITREAESLREMLKGFRAALRTRVILSTIECEN